MLQAPCPPVRAALPIFPACRPDFRLPVPAAFRVRWVLWSREPALSICERQARSARELTALPLSPLTPQEGQFQSSQAPQQDHVSAPPRENLPDNTLLGLAACLLLLTFPPPVGHSCASAQINYGTVHILVSETDSEGAQTKKQLRLFKCHFCLT